MKKEKMKQILLIVLAVFFMGVGMINFRKNTQQTKEVMADEVRNELSLGDVQLVNSEPEKEENLTFTSGIVSNDELNNNVNECTEETNKEASKVNDDEYFTETKLQRDQMYSEMIENYQKMLNSKEAQENQKAIATQEITNITNIKNGIMIAENLIKNKGFDDVVILVNNGNVSVVLKSSLLTQDQIAKVQNIVSREFSVDVKNINITNK